MHFARCNLPHFTDNWAPLAPWIAEQRPDLVIHTGDVTVDGADVEEDRRYAAELMRGLGVRFSRCARQPRCQAAAARASTPAAAPPFRRAGRQRPPARRCRPRGPNISTSCPIPKRGLSAGSRPPRSSKLRSRQISQSTARFCCCQVYGDPADRLLIATARQLSMPISMRDRQIAAYAAAGLTGEVALVLRNL
jgi:hypothetical protein